MSEERVLVRNAADEDQVANGRKKERFANMDEEDDIHVVLSTKQGRRFLWKLMNHCGVFKTVWANSALIHYNSGCQDMGRYVQIKIMEADKETYLLMQKENLA